MSLVLTQFAWINEAKIDPPGVDGDYEFVELRGQPSTSLAGHWLVAVEGDQESDRGRIDKVIDLSNCGGEPCRFDDQGLILLVADPVATMVPPGSAWTTASELANGGLENGTTSLWLVAGAWDGIGGVNWDLSGDGRLELPSDIDLRDAVGWTDGDSGDAGYAPVVLGPKPKVQAIVACEDTLGARTWRFGQMSGISASLSLDVSHSIPQGLDGLELTPGQPNHCPWGSTMSPESANAGMAGASPIAEVAGAAGRSSNQAVASAPSGGARPLEGTAASSSLASGVSGGARPLEGAGASASLNSPGGTASSASVGKSAPLATGSRSSSVVVSAGTQAPAGQSGTSPVSTGTIGSHPATYAGGGALIIATARARIETLAGSNGWWSPNPYIVDSIGGTSGVGSAASTGAPVGSTEVPSAQGTPNINGCQAGHRPGVPRSPMFALFWLFPALRRRRTTPKPQ